MVAKIKNRKKQADSHGVPRGMSLKAFERAYWPYLPLALLVVLLFAELIGGPVASLSHKPLSYMMIGAIAVLSVA